MGGENPITRLCDGKKGKSLWGREKKKVERAISAVAQPIPSKKTTGGKTEKTRGGVFSSIGERSSKIPTLGKRGIFPYPQKKK